MLIIPIKDGENIDKAIEDKFYVPKKITKKTEVNDNE